MDERLVNIECAKLKETQKMNSCLEKIYYEMQIRNKNDTELKNMMKKSLETDDIFIGGGNEK